MSIEIVTLCLSARDRPRLRVTQVLIGGVLSVQTTKLHRCEQRRSDHRESEIESKVAVVVPSEVSPDA
jgi:hypothetical protein